VSEYANFVHAKFNNILIMVFSQESDDAGISLQGSFAGRKVDDFVGKVWNRFRKQTCLRMFTFPLINIESLKCSVGSDVIKTHLQKDCANVTYYYMRPAQPLSFVTVS
jgi:hypothetical protein